MINAIFNGWADETLSARAYKHYLRGRRPWIKELIDLILFFDKNHCEESYKSELLRRHSPPETRSKY